MKCVWIGCCLGLVLAGGRLPAADGDWRPESSYGRRGHDVPQSIARAEEAEARGRFKKAIKYYEAVESHSVNLRNRARAVVAQGRCFESLDKPIPAYRHYRQALDEYGGFVSFKEVVDAEFAIANEFFNAPHSSFLGIDTSKDDVAIDIYDHIVRVAPYADVAPTALYRSGILSLRLGNTDEAIEKLRRVQNQYRNAPVAREAQVALAGALLNAAQEADGDGLLAREAGRQLDRFLSGKGGDGQREEAAALRARAAEVEARRLVDLATFYQRPGSNCRPAAARRYLEEAVAKYPQTESAREAEQRLSALAGEEAGRKAAPEAQDVPPVAAAGEMLRVSGTEPTPKPTGKGSGKWLLPVEDLGVIGNEEK